jgi:hypothetical protein
MQFSIAANKGGNHKRFCNFFLRNAKLEFNFEIKQ